MARGDEDPGRFDDPWESKAGEREESIALPPFLSDPLGVLQRRWIWMAAVLVLGMLGVGAAIALIRPAYEAEATVLITSQQIPEEFVRSTVREDSIANINAMVGKVLSQGNLNRILEEYSLYPNAEKMQRVDLIEQMRENIGVEPKPSFSRQEGSLIYGLTFEYTEPQVAADVANALAALFTETNMQRRNEQAQSTTLFLKRQLENDERELREHTQRVSEFRREHRGALPSDRDTNLRKIELLSERRQFLSTQISNKQNQIVTLSAMPDDEREKSENEQLLSDLRRELALQTAANTDAHPNVIALRDRIARLDRMVAEDRASPKIDPKVRRLMDAEHRELATLMQQMDATEADMVKMNELVDQMPAIAEEFGALERKEAVLRESYLDSLRKVEEAEVAENLESAQQGARVAVLDPAQPPTRPKRPRWAILLAGLLGSATSAIGIAILLELLDPVVISTSQLEEIADTPVLGAFPRLG